MPERSTLRRRLRAAAATLTSAALVAAGLALAAPAQAASIDVDGAVFRWGINAETHAAAFAPGTFNLVSAGVVDMTSATDRVSAANWKQSDGDVSIHKTQSDGTLAPATYAGLRTTAAGVTTTTGNGGNAGSVVEIADGTGTVDTAAGTASIQWTGTFTVAYYSGMTRFWVKDPQLTVADGAGKITATLGGWGSSMEDPEKFEVLTPVSGVTIADLKNVELTSSGFTVTPDYLGVTTTTAGQVTTGTNWGSFPQSFVDFQTLTGQTSYWFSSGGSADARKPALPLTVSFAAVAAPDITAQPQDADVAVGTEATFSVSASGEQLTYQWQRRVDDGEWADIDGATAATYAATATAADAGAEYRVVVSNSGGSVTSDAATLTVSADPLNVTGAQLEWAYSGYAQQGVFGPWYQEATGENVSIASIDAVTASGNTANAGRVYKGVRFDGGTGTIDPLTGAGTITWSTGLWTLNGYRPTYEIAPDESLSDPVLTIGEDGKGTLTVDAYLGEHLDFMSGTNDLIAPRGPERVTIATFSNVSIADGVLRITPDFTGRTPTIPSGEGAFNSCEGVGGSWPQEWLDFVGSTVRAHYYTTSCTGLNLTKPPFAFTVDTNAVSPTVVTQPVSVNVVPGATATFSTVVGGNPNPGVQWQSRTAGGEWTDLAGAVAASYALTVTEADYAREFRALVGGSVATDVVTIGRNTAPVITTQPVVPQGVAGGSATVSVVASSGLDLRYQWQSSLTTAAASFTDIPGATSSSHRITDLQSGVRPYYRVIVTNDAGSVTPASRRLNVSAEVVPTISTQPVNITRFVGGSASTAVFAPGFPATIYQLERQGADETWSPVGTASTSVPQLTALSADDDGARFRISLSNGVSPAILTDEFTLTVLPADGPSVAAYRNAGPIDAAEGGRLEVGVGGYADAPRFGYVVAALLTAEQWADRDALVGTDFTTVGLARTYAATSAIRTLGGHYWDAFSIAEGTLDPEKRYVVASFYADLAGKVSADRSGDDVQPILLAGQEPLEEVISETASFEWGINPVSQGASFNGACSFFVAGIADGTEASYKTVDGDLVLVKRGVGGQAIEVTAENRCLPIDGSDGAQRALFTHGTAVRTADGVVTVQWTGAFTIYSYGGLVPWYVQDPKLTVRTDGTASITATLGGFRSSMDDPNVKEPLAPETDMTILDLTDVTIAEDGTITSTPVYAGVDYFPLTVPSDPTSERRTTSAIPDAAKAANPNWGSWPQDLVDFQYRTGLSSYWHTSGLSADLQKPPSPVGLSLDAEPLQYTPFEQVSITAQPQAVDVILGADAEFHVAATGGDLTYRWQLSRDGYGWAWEDIDGATDARLVLNDLAEVTEFPDFAVRALVSNGVQRVASDAATLRVRGEAPVTLISEPTDQITHAGGTVSFYAYGEGFPFPTYQWQASTDGGTTWVDHGDTGIGNVLTLDTTEVSQNGTRFRAVLSNGVGPDVISASAALTVLPSDVPTLSVATDYPYYPYPIDTTLDEDNFLFVRGGGLPWPSTAESFHVGIVAADEWAARGADFSVDDLVLHDTLQTGGNVLNGAWGPAAIQILPGTLDTDTAYVAVTISATAGDRSYDGALPIQLAGQSAPTATVSASAGSVTAGSDVTLTATVTGTPAPTLQWQRQVAGGEWTDVADATDATLAVPGITESATYRIVATNGLGRVEAEPVAVTVIPAVPTAAPVITAQPASVLAPATPLSGAALVEFAVTVTGAPAPTVQWQKSDGDAWSVVGEGTTLAYAYTPADAGARFRAVATNSEGSATSEAATLTLGEPVSVTGTASAVTVVQGQPLSLSATVAGTAAVVRWQVLQPGAAQWTDVAGATAAVAAVPAADVRHGQQYRLVAEGPVPTRVGGPASTATSESTTVTLTAPSGSPADVPDAELGAPGGVEFVSVDGLTYTLSVGTQYAGQYVGVWVHSTPRALGWHLVDADGRLTVTLPDDLEPGAHRIVVVDANGELIGSLAISVAADGTTTAVLPATGGEVPFALVGFGLLALLGGAVVIGATRRRTRA